MLRFDFVVLICVKFWLPKQNANPNPNPKYLKNQIFPGQTAPVRGLSCHNKPAQEVSWNSYRWGARKDELPAITCFNKFNQDAKIKPQHVVPTNRFFFYCPIFISMMRRIFWATFDKILTTGSAVRIFWNLFLNLWATFSTKKKVIRFAWK